MKRFYIPLIFTLAVTACQDNAVEPALPADDGIMRFDFTGPGTPTKVSAGVFEAKDKLGLYVTDYIDAMTPAPLQISGNRANNEAVEFDGAEWTTERPVYWGEGKSDVYAYYPYMEIEDVDEQPFSVATDQSADNAYESSDFLWAKAGCVAQEDGAVSLQMKHAMSRLVVKIMAGEDYVGSLPADATVHLHSTVTDARISLANGSVVKYAHGGTHSIKMRNLGVRSFAEGDAVVYEAVVVPQMLETSVPLLEINSKSVSYLLEDMFNFKPGVSYTYTAVLNTSATAIRIDIGCSTDDWNNMGSGGDTGSGEDGGEDDGIDLSAYTDLSAEGTANCYLVKTLGNYKFKAVKGNSDDTVGNVKGVEVLWESFGTDVKPDVGDLVTNVGYKNGYVYFSTPEIFGNGNASIAVRNSKGVILWSWHIWCSQEGWNDHVYPNNAGTMMDRNLGATSATPGDVGAFGLLYQWGRKDPFMGACATSGTTLAASTGSWTTVTSSQTIDYAEENPMTFIGSPSEWCTGAGGGTSDYTKRWMESVKTMYDPCPVGYRVPKGGNDGFWAKALGTSSSSSAGTKWDSTNKGRNWTLADGETSAWYPAVGCRSSGSGALDGVGSRGFYWSSSNQSSSTYACYLNFYNGLVYPVDSYRRGNGHSVRCVRE